MWCYLIRRLTGCLIRLHGAPLLDISCATATDRSSSTTLWRLAEDQTASPFGDVWPQPYEPGDLLILCGHPSLASCHNSSFGVCTSLALSIAFGNQLALCVSAVVWHKILFSKALWAHCHTSSVVDFSISRPQHSTKLRKPVGHTDYPTPDQDDDQIKYFLWVLFSPLCVFRQRMSTPHLRIHTLHNLPADTDTHLTVIGKDPFLTGLIFNISRIDRYKHDDCINYNITLEAIMHFVPKRWFHKLSIVCN